MSSCGTTLKEKSVEVETPTGVEVETSMATGVEVVTNMPTGVEEPSTGVETNTCVLNSCKSENVCCGEKSLSEKTITVKLNATVVPAKFTRYRHPSHRHRLFMIISLGHNYCNNKKCRIQIRANKTMFRCFRCDYDLCGNCFQLGTTGEPVPLAEDDNDVDETTVEPVTSWCVEPEY
jgi:hypothetical protein